MTDREVDEHVALLKDELDAVGRLAKAALQSAKVEALERLREGTAGGDAAAPVR